MIAAQPPAGNDEFIHGGKMTKVRDNETAPDFTLADTEGQDITLSAFRGERHVVLVFNRGFM